MSFTVHPADSANSEEFDATAFLLSLSPSQIETVHQGFYDLQTGLSVIANNAGKTVVEVINDWDSDIGEALSAHNSSMIYTNYFRKNFVHEIKASLGSDRNPGVFAFILRIRTLIDPMQTQAALPPRSATDALHHFNQGTPTGKRISQIFIDSIQMTCHLATLNKKF